MGIRAPTQYTVPWSPTNQQPKRHLTRFIRFCRADARIQQTDRQTDHATCVTIDRILCYALRCGLFISVVRKI